MLYRNRFDVSESVYGNKKNAAKECTIWNYW